MPFSGVTVRADQMGDLPCIRGLRIQVAAVVAMLADGMMPNEILSFYPDLSRQDISEVLRFAAETIRMTSEQAAPDAAPDTRRHIDVSGDRPVVRGTDIKVSQIASESEHLGMTPDEIVHAHPHLSLADVHAALAYYFDNQPAVRDEWQEARALIAELRSTHPSRFVR